MRIPCLAAVFDQDATDAVDDRSKSLVGFRNVAKRLIRRNAAEQFGRNSNSFVGNERIRRQGSPAS